jgi:hypothetical protein
MRGKRIELGTFREVQNAQGDSEYYGFSASSEIGKLINYVRDEYRAKYGVDYKLSRIGKNQWIVHPGTTSDYGVEIVNTASVLFNTRVIRHN